MHDNGSPVAAHVLIPRLVRTILGLEAPPEGGGGALAPAKRLRNLRPLGVPTAGEEVAEGPRPSGTILGLQRATPSSTPTRSKLATRLRGASARTPNRYPPSVQAAEHAPINTVPTTT